MQALELCPHRSITCHLLDNLTVKCSLSCEVYNAYRPAGLKSVLLIETGVFCWKFQVALCLSVLIVQYIAAAAAAGGGDNDDDAGDCQAWRTLWLDEAFWHVLFAVDIILIMIVCRPTRCTHSAC